MSARLADSASCPDDPGVTPLTVLKGVGPALAATLARLGLQRMQDLWFHLPLRYEDRTRMTALARLARR